MTDRTQEEIQADIRARARTERLASEEGYAFKKELRQAKMRDAMAAPHPWAGKKVVLPPGGRGTKNQRGVVVLGDDVYRGLTNHHPRAGEWYVRSKGGQGRVAYRIGPTVGEDGRCDGWELGE
jgi:hypothetical protein